VQFCSSRKPFPVPPVFENPIVYCLAAAEGEAAGSDTAGADGAGALGAVVAAPGDEHAATRTAIAVRPNSRMRLDALIIRSPPRLDDPPTWRVACLIDLRWG
jgi:hypothetical protein